MEVVRHARIEAFEAAARDVLMADEARHNLVLGICHTLTRDPGHYESFEAWTVVDAGTTVAAALRTPPYNLLLAQPATDAALDALAGALADEGVGPPGVTGAHPEVDSFAEAWRVRTGRGARVRLEQGIYRAPRALLPAGVDGALRLGTRDDRELLVRWFDDFAAEAMPPGSPRHDASESVDRRLERDGGIALWEVDGEPVSCAGFGSRTPSGVRIGPVYTPPEQRRRGYGSALTAHLTQRLLDSGRTFCFLYTDLSNPTSNGIYRAVGYELVCESADLVFDA